MFIVLFEVEPRAERFEEYLSIAGALRPELERIDGFIENIRWRSLRRPGWLLSVSTWRDEAALVAWRRHAGHHAAQWRGREGIFRDYRLRVGRIAESAPGTVCLTEAEGPRGDAEEVGYRLGLPLPAPPGLLGWDAFEALLTPGRFLLMECWGDVPPADRSGTGWRAVQVVRDYGMHSRAQAPQSFPPVSEGR